MQSITGSFQNNLLNVSEVTTVALPAELEPANLRMGTDPVYASGGEVYQSLSIPKYTIMKKFYLVVTGDMTGTATVTLSNGGNAIFTDVDISTSGFFVSTAEDILTDTQEGFDITLSTDQVGTADGTLQVLCDFASIDTNNGTYGSSS
jgi:hypothetical protein